MLTCRIEPRYLTSQILQPGEGEDTSNEATPYVGGVLCLGAGKEAMTKLRPEPNQPGVEC